MGNILGSTSSSATPLLTEEDTQGEEESGVVLPERARLPPPRFGNHITVLSIDGGGIRGLIPAVVLQRLEEKLQRAEKELHNREENVRIADYFDVVAGTSTGALITAMLVTPGENDRPKYTAEEIKDFYVKNGSKIFPPKRWWWKGPLSMIRTLWGAKYHGTFLHDEIRRKVGEITLDETLCKIVVPTFDVNRMEPVIFSSYRKRTMVQVEPGLSDICIGTSAAPTFFPAHNFETTFIDGNKDKDFHLIDGGVAANNPTMSAISTVTKEQLMKNEDFRNKGMHYRRYLVISLGTGSAVHAQPVYTAKGCAKWGALGWAHNWRNGHSPIIDIFSNASAVLVDWHVAMLLHNGDPEDKQNYLRIQAQLTKDMPMDDATPENIQSLVDVGNDLMAKKVHTVNLFTGRYQEDITRLQTNDEELTRLAWLLVQERARRFGRVKEEAKAKAEAAKAEAEAAKAEAEAAKAEAEADAAAEAEALAAETDEELERLFRLLVQERGRRIARQRAADAAAEAEAEAAEPAAEPAEAEAPAADAAAEAEAAEPAAEPAEAEAPAADAAAEAEAAELAAEPAEAEAPAAAEAAQQRRRKAAEAEAPAADAAAEAEAAADAAAEAEALAEGTDEVLERWTRSLVQERARRIARQRAANAAAEAEAAEPAAEPAEAEAPAADAAAEAEAAEPAAEPAEAEAPAADAAAEAAQQRRRKAAEAEAPAADAAAEAEAEAAADAAAEAEALAEGTDEDLERWTQSLVQERARRIARQRAADAVAEAEAAEPAAEPAEAEAPAADVAAEAEAAEPAAEPAEAEAPAADAAAEAEAAEPAEAEAEAADAVAEAEAAEPAAEPAEAEAPAADAVAEAEAAEPAAEPAEAEAPAADAVAEAEAAEPAAEPAKAEAPADAAQQRRRKAAEAEAPAADAAAETEAAACAACACPRPNIGL